jgi:hypothetical protein
MIYGYCVGDWICVAVACFVDRSTLDDSLIEDKLAGSPHVRNYRLREQRLNNAHGGGQTRLRNRGDQHQA